MTLLVVSTCKLKQDLGMKFHFILVGDLFKRTECDRQGEACSSTQYNRLWVECTEEPCIGYTEKQYNLVL